MNIIVCLKQVPDTETKIVLKSGEKKISEEGVNFVINPYDEFAVEEAIRIKEKLGGEITVVCIGPTRATEAIRTALAMGADKAVHLDDPAIEGADSVAISTAISKIIQGQSFDLILCGKQAVDDDCAQVGARLAELLNLPEVSIITKLEILDGGKKAKVTRQIEGALEVLEVPLPAVFTCQKGLNEPRYPTLPNIMKAKKKELKQIKLQDLGISVEEKMKIVDLFLPQPRQAGKIIEKEDLKESAKELVKLLHEEAKVI